MTMMNLLHNTLRFRNERLKYRVVIPGLIYGLILASIALVEIMSGTQL